MNKHGVARGWFTKADVTDFESGALTPSGLGFFNQPQPGQGYLKFGPLELVSRNVVCL